MNEQDFLKAILGINSQKSTPETLLSKQVMKTYKAFIEEGFEKDQAFILTLELIKGGINYGKN